MSLRAAYEEMAEAGFTGEEHGPSAFAEGEAGGEAEGESRRRTARSKRAEALRDLEQLKRAGASNWGALMIAFEAKWTEFSCALQPKR